MNFDQWTTDFYKAILNTPLQKHLAAFVELAQEWQSATHHDKQKVWQKQILKLPSSIPFKTEIGNTIQIGDEETLTVNEKKKISAILQQFMPWRKGPFNFFGVQIDTEWRSDWKWQRVLPHIQSLANKRVLDVGCGSGYHLWRMHQEQAEQVIGIDPTTLFFYQFHCVKRYLPNANVHFLPLGIEQLPATKAFDTLFSMGVLYHRLDPLLFLKQLKQQLVKGGELVLETLVIAGDDQTVLLPSDRYAQMGNVYFIPSSLAMIKWLQKVGFSNVRLVDENDTTIEEQRTTEWMPNHSLIDFLDPQDHKKTIEGYPAPRRATFIATA
ncbi:tRNA 5-methoxyuridine(34)/uridine 5-oxyacetic acid(34) synthase CmoB [Glaciecola sp. 1036]|uniref:tRNA 5-methoxyuridine(34)/uridine 5-oxyacetic acid(34) synthase CmoB n=1 Tax=Alteromonadaceae TaxID=72275 RepID=UPI003D050293